MRSLATLWLSLVLGVVLSACVVEPEGRQATPVVVTGPRNRGHERRAVVHERKEERRDRREERHDR